MFNLAWFGWRYRILPFAHWCETFPPLCSPFCSPPVINASLHRNVLSWVVWQGQQQQKDSVYLGAITHSVYSWTSDRTAAVPAVVGEGLTRTFSFLCPAAREVWPSWESICPDTARERTTYSATTTGVSGKRLSTLRGFKLSARCAQKERNDCTWAETDVPTRW